MSNSIRRIARDEAGLTLVELLISITILGIIMPVLFATMFAGAHDITNVASKITDSHDGQMLSAYFVQDVQSADDVATTNSTCLPSSAADVDGDGDSDDGSSTALLALHWTDRATNDQRVVTYFMDLETAPLTNSELIRQYCVNGAIASTVVVAHGLAAAATFTCNPAACTNQPSEPTGVTLQVAEASAGTSNCALASSLCFTVSATRRSTP